MKKKSKSKFLKLLISFFVVVVLCIFFIANHFHKKIFQPNISINSSNSGVFVEIPTGSDFDDVIEILSKKGILVNYNSFKWVSDKKNYIYNVKPGRYFIENSISNNKLVNILRSGRQKVIKLTFNNVRTVNDLAGVISKKIEADSSSIVREVLNPVFLKKLELTKDKVGCIFIPNTYEFYWNTSARDFVERMLIEYKKFWSQKSRKNKADRLGLNWYEISVLASIVEKEQNIKYDERPKIAGLYLNRLEKKMKLESDPTLIFAIGDFDIKRVLNKDKKIDSPYNTYLNQGLPPGPICIPSINSIDAVLNHENHGYIFMCAKEDFSGYHNFAYDYSTHLVNARKYQRALNKKKILR